MRALIRAARPEDAPALGAILSDWIDETSWMPRLHTRVQDATFVGHLIENGTVLVAEAEADPVGFLCREDDELTALYIAKAHRGRGIGKTLLDEAKLGQQVLSLWTFQANFDAIRFYAHQGFVEVDRSDGVNAEGLPDIQMIWEQP